MSDYVDQKIWLGIFLDKFFYFQIYFEKKNLARNIPSQIFFFAINFEKKNLARNIPSQIFFSKINLEIKKFG